MNEKRFYHTALDRTLLGGKSVKKQIDAKIRAEKAEASRQKSARSASRNAKEWNPRPVPWIAIPVAAMLLLCTLTIGITAGARALRDSKQAAASATPQPTATPAPVQTMHTGAQADIDLKDLGCTVKLLPEFDDELKAECLDWRQSQGGEPYREEDWTWLKSATMTITDLRQSGSRIQWTEETVSEPLQPFLEMRTNAAGQSVELSLDSVTYTVEGDDTVYSLGTVFNETDWKPETDRFFMTWCNERSTSDTPLPAEGIVTMTATYCVVDFKVEDMGRRFGSVALIEHTFSYDAAKLNQAYAVPPVQQRGDDETYRVLLVTETDNADRYASARKAANLPALNEAEWEWLRSIEPELDSMHYDGTELIWAEHLQTADNQAFTAEGDGNLRLSIRTESIAMKAEHNTIGAVAYGGSAANLDDRNAVIVASYESSFFSNGELANMLWQDETQTVTTTYRVIDQTALTDGVPLDAAVVATIEHTFRVDKNELLADYGTQPKQVVELGVKNDSIPGLTVELCELYTGSRLSAVLKVSGDSALPKLTLDAVGFRTPGRSATPASVVNDWMMIDAQHATTTVFFPIDQNPIWPGNTMIVEGKLNGEDFILSYTYPFETFREWTVGLKTASAEALAAKAKVTEIETAGSPVGARSGLGHQNVVVSRVLREGNVLYVLTMRDSGSTTENYTELLYSDFDEGFWPMIDGRPCDYAALVAQEDSLTSGFAYCVMLPYPADRLPEESLIGFEGAMFRYNWRTGEATVPNGYEEYLAMRKESYELAKPYCTADWIWRFHAESEGFAATDLVFHNKTMNGVIGLVLEETASGEMEDLFDPHEAPVLMLDGIPLVFNADANKLDPTLGNRSKDGKRCGYCYFGYAAADLPETFELSVMWRGKTASVTLNKSDVIRLPDGDDRSYHDVFGY